MTAAAAADPRWRKSSHSNFNGSCAEVAAWRKSSHSTGGECAEVGAWQKSSHSAACGDCIEFRKSSHSMGNECAEVGQDGTVVGVRDSKDPDGPVLVFRPEKWTAFLAGLKG